MIRHIDGATYIIDLTSDGQGAHRYRPLAIVFQAANQSRVTGETVGQLFECRP